MKKKGSTKKKNIKKKKKTTVNNHKPNRKKKKKVINIVQKQIKNIKQKHLSKKIEYKEENARKKEEKINVKINKSSKIVLRIVILIFIAILIWSVSLLFRREDTSHLGFTKITLKEYVDLYKSEQLQYIYITSNNCTYCDLLEPYLSRLESEYNIEFKSLNISGLSEEKISQITESNSVFEREWKAPILISIKNGKEVSNIRGYKEYAVLRKFVEYSQNPTESNSFINISINKYLSIIKSNELSVIYIGRSRSNSCKRFVPILEKVSVAKGFKVYYLNTDTLDTESDWDALKNSNKIFEGTWFMPATIIVRDNVIIDYEMQAMNEFDLIEFFDKNGI